MTVLNKWTDWRYRAAVKIEESPALVFVAPSTITRAAGDFVALGYEAGMTFDVFGTLNNDKRFTIDTVAVGALTMAAADVVVAEPSTITPVLGVHRDTDQVEEFPGLRAEEAGRTKLVRSGGFDSGLSGVPVPYAGVVFEVTANATAADAVALTDEYDWYLSQRTDTAAKQYVTIAQKATAAGQTFSGTVTIVHSALATSELGTLTTPSIEQTTEVFKHCDLYCKRLSDGAIQWVSMLRIMLGAT